MQILLSKDTAMTAKGDFKLNLQEQQRAIRLYTEQQWSLKRIGDYFGISPEAVRHVLIYHGIPRRFGRGGPGKTLLSENRQREACQRYVDDAQLGIHALASEYDISYKTMWEVLTRHDVQKRPAVRPRARLNDQFFDVIDSEAKAYFLGLLAADGWIEANNPKIGISLKRSDECILQTFLEFLDTTYHIYQYRSGLSGIVLWSPHMVGALRKLGFTSNKSLEHEYPPILPQWDRDFIRGCFDGDGGWAVYRIGTCTFTLNGTIPFLEEAQAKLMHYCNLRKTAINPQHDTEGVIRGRAVRASTSLGRCGQLSYGGRFQIPRIANWFYKDATIWLPRKRQKYERWLAVHGPQAIQTAFCLPPLSA